ncbi:hypothetical protein diail_6173 [Diaporthe ilicicola]|nr:hypothetical protein diail_6173 [Diaporthe ilicicola]
MTLSHATDQSVGGLAGDPAREPITKGLLEEQQYGIFAFLHNIYLITFTFICLFSGLERSDRPIRPLPKRRLRERLSPEVADSIEYPPARQSAPALFSYPCNLKGGLSEEESSSGTREPRSDFSGRHTPRRNGANAACELDEVSTRRAVVARAPTESLGRPPRLLQKSETTRQGHAPQPPPSAASSADGYDSFENTNNKKKRKIPTAGEMNGAHGLGDHGLNDTHAVSPGLVAIPDRAGENGNSTSVPYYGSGSFLSAGQNVSGPGRGRFGRARNGRSPLQPLSDASGNWLGRNSKSRPGPWSPTAQSTGIISNAIANAEKLPALEGQENTSLLHQQPSVKATPATTQFTFTCDSQVPGTLAWPGSDPKMSASAATDYNQAPAGSYSHSRAGQTHQPVGAPSIPGQENPPSDSSLRGEAPQSATLERKNRRRAAKDLHFQARKRREGTARQNFLNPPKLEDQWICEFCEYERIFGYPPVALIRQYEIKDRRVRQQEEERRRVWEKAKARSRKGKKSKAPSKNSANNNGNGPGSNVHSHSNDAQTAPPMDHAQSQDTQSDIFDDDEYEGEGHCELDPSQRPSDHDHAQKAHPVMPEHDRDGGVGGRGGPLNASTANPNAATAAISAFTRRQSSTASLSAAAAAAALKARPTTPTNVAEVQTKRNTRRSASRSSSAGRSTPDATARPGGQLRRQASSGSMTERTFRSSSPGAHAHTQRSLSSGGIPRNSYHSDEMAPPVPALPQSVNMQAAKARQKPKSLGIVTAPVRTASQRAKEKPGNWFGPAKTGDPANVRTSDAIMSTSPTVQTQSQSQAQARAEASTPAQPRESLERPASRGSPVNFSYPARIRSPTFARPEGTSQSPASVAEPRVKSKRSSTMSPPRGGSVRAARSSSVTSDQTLVYDPNSRRMVPQADLSALDSRVQAASEARPKKKKQVPARAGSHLAKGTVSRPQGSALASSSTNAAQVAAATSLRSHQAEQRRSVVQEPEDEDEQPPLESTPSPPQPAEEQHGIVEPPHTRYAQVAMPPASNAPEVVAAPQSPTVDSPEAGLHRKPSVVREETEPEDLESEIELEAPVPVSTPPKASSLESLPARQNMYTHGVPSPPRSDLTEDIAAEPTRAPPAIPTELAAAELSSSSEPRVITRDGENVAAEPRETQDIRRDSRTQSKSPVRNARFGPVHDSLTVRHEPPLRSISPRKSALKHQSPSRGASPADAASDGSEAGFTSYEQVMPRKKSVRVSFDDGNTVVVGEAAGRAETDSSLPPSPQVASRRPWYSSLGIGKKKDAIPLEEDEGMKPRPMLPTFGSVRGRKQSPKEPEERPLVRPQEPVHEESEPASPEPLGRGADTVGQSSDHALGAMIHEHEPKNEANNSKFREPLPPVVTSVEGSGYASDTASDDSEAALMADTPRLQADESRVSEASTLVPDWEPRNGSAHERAGGEQVDSEFKDFAGEPQDEPAEVPAISITQPSPHIVEAEQDRTSYRFPGEFPETDAESDAEIETKAHDSTSPDSFAPTRQAAFEPVVQAEDATVTVHTPSTVLATKPFATEVTDESDGDSVYSDAYEDPLDLEGDGFQSLDAVIESPPREAPHDIEKGQAQVAESSMPSLPHKAPGHETAAITLIQKEGISGPIDDWAAAKAYWRSLTADKRAQLEKEAAEEAGAEGDLEDVNPEVRKPRRKKSVEKRSAEKRVIEEQRAAVNPERTYMIRPGSKAENYGPGEQSTQRGKQVSGEVEEAGTKLRKTMRSPVTKPSQPAQPAESGTRMRKSLRPDAPGRSAATPQQPASPPPALGITTEITGPNRHSRASSEPEGRPSITQPSLRRRGSDSSASSFKRSRPVSQGFGFRKTMRTGNGPQDPEEPLRDRQPSRLSLRSMSPGGGGRSSLRGQPPVAMDGKMRTTLRGGPPANKRRSSQDSGKGYLRFSGSFGQKAKNKKGSRFGDDSSDEDEADAPRRFSSRFDDSSDEEISPEPLPPLSIPKTMRGARSRITPPSPPLPEEEELSDDQGRVGGDEDDKSHRVTSGPASLPHAQTEPTVKRSRSGRGSLPRADDGAGRPARRSFMSSVLRRNKKQGSGAITRPERKESAARADTGLERSPGELDTLRSNALRDRADSGATWPLNEEGPEHKTIGVETHEPDEVKGAQVIEGGGVVVNGQRSPSVLGHSKSQPSLPRPSFLQRRTMSHQGTIDTDTIGSEAGGKKKKKFGVLRRMFKLDE